MSALSEQGPTNPQDPLRQDTLRQDPLRQDSARQDPLRYAPRRAGERPELRLSAVSSRVGETAFDRLSKLEPARRPLTPPSSLSAELENAVFESLRRQMDPEVIAEPPGFAQEQTRRRRWLAAASAVGVAAVAAALFVTFMPASPDNTAGFLAAVAPSGLSQSRDDNGSKPALAQFRSLLVTGEGNQTITHEQSEKLLKQFEQWRQKPDAGDQAR